MNQRVAIQGIRGSNHHRAAEVYFGSAIELVECLSFPDLVDQLLLENADQAVMAIENSIAGSIIPNYALVDTNNLEITGECYLNIHHNLMGLPGQHIREITEARSHPMALLQCREFLKTQPHIKLVEDVDTAETARAIRKHTLQNVAAIAPTMAATLYKLQIIASDIQTTKNNVTRFIILKTRSTPSRIPEINKASMRFVIDHKRGSLATILNVMSDCNLNLTKIQSLPIIETPWKYAFFVDVTFEKYNDFDKAKSLLQIMSDELQIMGEYKNQLILPQSK